MESHKSATFQELLSFYESHIEKYKLLNFTFQTLEDDTYFKSILYYLCTKYRDESFSNICEFQNCYNDHFDRESGLLINKRFTHACSMISSFMTSLIMCKYH